MRRSRLPCVLLNARDPEGVMPSVKDDFRTGMRLLAEALVAHGHRRIACLDGGPDGTPDAAERIRELDDNLRRHGIERPATLTEDISRGLEAPLERLFALPGRPTAIFCCTDRVAYRALPLLDRMGLRVPEDVSVVGYDGIRWPSDSPHLVDSVKVDLTALTEAAVTLLLDGPSEACEVTLPTILLRGTTLGPAS
jgi:DNA-binding LacI/PurR family transcriptional regulator